MNNPSDNPPESSVTNAGSMDISDILSILPHRYPFILVDRILSWTPKKNIVALKNVTMNEPFFQGHFPGHPIFPGVLLMEGLAQAGAVLAYRSTPELLEGKLVYFAGMDSVRFRRPVTPGDQVHFHLDVLKMKTRIWRMAGRAMVDNTVAAEAELLATFA